MFLVDTLSLKICEFVGDKIPPYVILSHTWGEDEVSYQDMLAGIGQDKTGYHKIVLCSQQAQRDGFAYAWIDTCCIDKKSSAELSEAINSMYAWYENSQICYVYLVDTKRGLFVEGERCSRWFTRGWTLQELLAPRHVEFYDRDWERIGTKVGLATEISQITGIKRFAMLGVSPRNFFVAEIFSWAAGRQTAREEDRAYSLLGLFGINMPLLYGEGKGAFQRLQKKILKSSNDHTVLAWIKPKMEGDDGSLILSGLLATSPDDFKGSHGVYSDKESPVSWPPVLAQNDVILTMPMIILPYNEKTNQIWVDIGCRYSEDTSVFLRLLGDNGRFRMGPLLAVRDRIREEYDFVTKTIRVARYSLEGPERTPLAYHFKPKLPGNTKVQMVLRYFAMEGETDEAMPHEWSPRVTYNERVSFNAASLTEIPELQTLALPEKGEVTLRPNSDWAKSDGWDTETPEGRIAYTVCVVLLKTQASTGGRVAIGAVHDPVTRPWVIAEGVDQSKTDEEWCESIVRNWDAGDDTPDQSLAYTALPGGEVLRIAVMLKKRAPDPEIEVPCFNVLLSVTQSEEPLDAMVAHASSQNPRDAFARRGPIAYVG